MSMQTEALNFLQMTGTTGQLRSQPPSNPSEAHVSRYSLRQDIRRLISQPCQHRESNSRSTVTSVNLLQRKFRARAVFYPIPSVGSQLTDLRVVAQRPDFKRKVFYPSVPFSSAAGSNAATGIAASVL